jgi:sigma-E factor negative regulatory protein RseC
VEAINMADAQVGDLIQLAVSTGSVMKAMFLLYLFPILCMLTGGAAGNWMAPRMQINPSVMAAIGAMACFVISLIFVRILGQRMGRDDAYRPKIIRILGHDTPDQPMEPFPESCANRVEN